MWNITQLLTLGELWPYEVGGPSYVSLKPQKVKEVKELAKKKLLFK
jgi:hypothetical protein